MTNRGKRELLTELKIERGDRPAGNAAQRNAISLRKGLFLGAIALAISSGLVWMNWGAIKTAASGTSMEPASQEEKVANLEVPATPELPGDIAKPVEMSMTPASDEAIAFPNQDLATILDATGYVVARRTAIVGAQITGKLASVSIEEGDHVQSGQLIALLDDSAAQAELALAESRLISAKSQLRELEISIEHADRRLARSMELARRHLVSEEHLDDDRLGRDGLIANLHNVQQEIEVARRQRDVREVQVADTRIRAPFSGVVVEKSAHPGEVISPMSVGSGRIATIVDMNSLEVEVDINEAYLNRVFPNQPARVRLNAYPENSYEAQVIAIVPTADRNRATVRVRIGLLEKDDRVLPNMGVQVGFISEANANKERTGAQIKMSETRIEL